MEGVWAGEVVFIPLSLRQLAQLFKYLENAFQFSLMPILHLLARKTKASNQHHLMNQSRLLMNLMLRYSSLLGSLSFGLGDWAMYFLPS
ncbi:hypothetical protein BMS3Bbin04_00713 [bacterium BMS3Bbin04]|nr:hypothetical protein BMS3Bbin04_00713 [bacterium BMS3Bbin04]